MVRNTLHNQAMQLEAILPKLMRRLFTLDPCHPVNELPLAQLRVCSILQAGPRSMSAISKELGISFSATTQIADRLERAGLVERVAEEDDRRVRKLQLTTTGGQMMQSRRESRVHRVTEVMKKLPPQTRRVILRSLESLLHASDAMSRKNESSDPIGVRLEQ